MASLLKLGVDTGQWDAGLKKAQSALNNFVKANGGLQQTLDKDSSSLQKFVRMMGDMTSNATTASGKMNDYKRTLEQLTSSYNSLSSAQKKSEVGSTYLQSIESIKKKYHEAKVEVDSFNRSLNGSSISGGGKELLGGIAGQLGMSASMFTGIGAAIAGAGAAIKLFGDNVRTALNFETSMSQLSALTGKTGKDLETLKDYAIELGSTTTLTASQVADAFRLIGSQQPQLLESSEALKEVTKYAIQLSEAAGIELATASQTLSTSINQMGGDSSQAARFVNVLAAASQKGAGDIAWLGESLTKSATAAKAVGTEYEELVANLEQLAKAGFDASTAGTALRSIIMNLEKQSNNNFRPSVVGLTQAFENLKKANLDIVGYQELVGKMFATQAMALSEASQEAKNMTDAITGTNIAEEQARTNTDNLSGSIKSLQSAWEGLNLHLNSSNGLLRKFVDLAKEAVKFADRGFTFSGKLSGFREDLQNKQSTKMFGQNITGVVPNLQRLGGSNYKTQVYHEIQQMYNEAILAGIEYRDKHTRPGTQSREEAQANLDAIKAAQEEFTNRAKKMMGWTSDTNENGGNAPKVEVEVEAETENATKSIKELQGEIKKLKQLRDEAAAAGNTTLRDQYNAQIKAAQDEIKALRGTATSPKKQKPDATAGQLAADTRNFSSVSLKSLENATIVTTSSMKELQAELSRYKKMLSEATTSQEYATATSGISRTQRAIAAQPIALEMGISMQEAEVERQVRALKDNLESYFKDNPISINVESGIAQDGKAAEGSWKEAAKAVQSVGSAIQQIENPAAKVAGIVAQSIATVALAYADTLAKDSGSKSNIFAFIAAAAAATISMATTIASIHSTTGYEKGGIIKGNSYSGDRIAGMANGELIGLDAGELVLTRAMQGSLAAQLNDGARGGGISSTPYVTGEKIVLGINNYARRHGMGELVFSHG